MSGTNINLVDSLVSQGLKITGLKTKRECILPLIDAGSVWRGDGPSSLLVSHAAALDSTGVLICGQTTIGRLSDTEDADADVHGLFA